MPSGFLYLLFSVAGEEKFLLSVARRFRSLHFHSNYCGLFYLLVQEEFLWNAKSSESIKYRLKNIDSINFKRYLLILIL